MILELVTERLLLRGLELSDLDAYAAICADPGVTGLEVGWVLGRRYWGRGFATEAARAALHHAFSALGARRVISLIHPDNERSIRVAERLGERFDRRVELSGTPHHVYVIDGGGGTD